MDDRKKAMEELVRRLSSESSGVVDSRDLLPGDKVSRKIFDARDLLGETLADQVLKNTGVPIPSSGASDAKVEDFLNRIAAERYPEFADDPNVRLSKGLKPGEGAYYGKSGRSVVGAGADVNKSVSTMLHELGHRYDDKKLGYDMPAELIDPSNKTQMNLPKAWDYALDSDNPNPTLMLEKAAKGHHARIPNLRDANSFELGALKSMLKSGTFKQAAGALPLVGGLAAAAMSEDASAAVPVLGEAGDVGESKSEEFQMLEEDKARKNYGQSQARMDALKKIKGGF